MVTWLDCIFPLRYLYCTRLYWIYFALFCIKSINYKSEFQCVSWHCMTKLIILTIWLCCVNVWFCVVRYKPKNEWLLLFTLPLGGSLYFLLSKVFTLGIFTPGPLNVYVTFNSAPLAKHCLALAMKGNWEEMVCLLKVDHLLTTSGCCSTVAVKWGN